MLYPYSWGSWEAIINQTLAKGWREGTLFIMVPKKYPSVNVWQHLKHFVTNCGNFMATKRFKINTIFTWKSIAASITFLVWCLFGGGAHLYFQRAKKVVFDSPGLVDFAIGLVIFVLNLPNGQVLFFGEIQITGGLQSVLLIKKGFGASWNDLWASTC